MRQIVNEKYKSLFTTKARYIILMGGRGAGRSTVASQFANAKLAGLEYFRCAIMRYVLGDIRNSIYREITDRAEENGILEALHVNDTMMTIDYGANSINAVGFKKSSSDQKAKLKSLANYTTVIIEEADEISEGDFMQLDDSLRTVKGSITIILLLNCPPKSHWIIKRWFNLLPSGVKGFYVPQLKPEHKDTLFIRSSFRDNIKNLDEQSIARYEGYALTKPAHYYNMIQGLVPETVQGKIYNNWQEIEEIPPGARLVRRWLDYGYSNDPAAIGEIWKWNDAWVLNENVYQTHLNNTKLIAILDNMEEKVPVASDSSEPKSNDDLIMAGITVLPAKKGADSVNHGIDLVSSQKIYYTKRSKNIKLEYDNYKWKVDKEGNGLNVPIDLFNHHMDGIRYGFESLIDAVPDHVVKKQDAHLARNEERIRQSSTR